MKNRISGGVFAPISTPFQLNEDLDINALKYNMNLYSNSQIHGYLVLGSNGENKSLTEEEKLDVLNCVSQNKNDNQIVMAGAFYESQRQTINFLKEAAKIGVDFGLVQSPSYFKKLITEDLLVRFFTEIADQSPIPILLYNAPGFTGITLSFSLLETIHRHPNIVGMKDSSADGIFQNLQLQNDNFKVMAGSISKLFPAMLKGSAGGTVSFANYLPNMAFQLWKYGEQKSYQQGEEFHNKLLELNKKIAGQFAVPGVKAAMNLLGFKGGIPRKPLLPLNDEQIHQIKAALDEAGVKK